MSKISDTFEFTLLDGSKASIQIIPETAGTLHLIDPAEAREQCEAEIQLEEGRAYEYHLGGYLLQEERVSCLVHHSRVNPSSGRLTPGNYVGTISIDVVDPQSSAKKGVLRLEVRSIKMNYREHYREMLGNIADQCNELLLQAETPLSVMIEPLFSGDSRTIYQRFAFLRSVLDSREFSDAVQKILANRGRAWREAHEQQDIRRIKRFSRDQVKQLCSSSRRSPLPHHHAMYALMQSLPTTLESSVKTQTLDTPENRFVKHALNSFLMLCLDVRSRLGEDSRLKSEAEVLIDRLEQHLGSHIFKELSAPRVIPLNSPVLQRKEGYREVFRVWLMHDLASRITWKGGEDVYEGGKKDVAILYEYWVYFKLLDIVKDVFKIESSEISNLLAVSQDGLGLSIKRGQYTPIFGVYQAKTRLLNIEFSYNRSYSGDRQYPEGGSWTRSFRPDYSLSIWPCDTPLDFQDQQSLERDKQKAEAEETIVHVHFDAKYRVEDLNKLLGDEQPLQDEQDIRHKEADLLKMHAYRDAIRRTGGAYIIYPGNAKREFHGFHEIIPGLGAFPLNPGFNEANQNAIKAFLKEIAEHVENRATQREKLALKSYQVHKDKPGETVYATMPSAQGAHRDLLPDETTVLVGWYKDSEHLEWISSKGLYNIRIDLLKGSLHLNSDLIGARYLLLHGPGDACSGRIMELSEKGPLIKDKQFLITARYPDVPSQDYYMIFEISNRDVSSEFGSCSWDYSKLQAYPGRWRSGAPFTATLSELMKHRVQDSD